MLISISMLDLDHMPGARVQKTETLHSDFKKWKHHADTVNSKYLGDDAEISTNSKVSEYSVDGKVVARWDFQKKIGTVSNTGKPLK